MKFYSVIITKFKGQSVKENSPVFDNQLGAECWLHNCMKEARELKVKVVDHYICKVAK